jgi:hypothetical protein
VKSKDTILGCALGGALTLASCARYASVSEKKPQFRPVRAAVGALVSTERRIGNALRQENREKAGHPGNCCREATS